MKIEISGGANLKITIDGAESSSNVSVASAGSKFQRPELKPGESYAGIILGRDGAPDFHLIELPCPKPEKEYTWQQAMDWAQLIGGDLPDRNEARLLLANSANSRNASGYHWTSTPDADLPDYAWIQGFDYGYQAGYRKSNEYRARAVRRLEI